MDVDGENEMQTLEKPIPTKGPDPRSEEIRGVLLASARRAGCGFVHVRGVDLVAAITGTIPDDWEPAS